MFIILPGYEASSTSGIETNLLVELVQADCADKMCIEKL